MERKIYIFGLGAIGSNVLSQLIRVSNEIEFIGVDFDKVEEKNIPTQAYLLPTVGHPKASAIYSSLGSKSRKFKYKGVILKVESKEDISKILTDFSFSENDIILDCFDNTKSRKLFEEFNFNILHIGFSNRYAAEIIWHDNYSVPNEVPSGEMDICTMREAIYFINFVTSFSCFVISDFIENNIKRSFIITNKIKIIDL